MTSTDPHPYRCPGCGRPLADRPAPSTSHADQPWLEPRHWCRGCGGSAELHLRPVAVLEAEARLEHAAREAGADLEHAAAEAELEPEPGPDYGDGARRYQRGDGELDEAGWRRASTAGPSRVIRVDPEVLEALDELRRPTDRNYSQAIRRLLEERELLELLGDHPDADRPPGTSGSWGEA